MMTTTEPVKVRTYGNWQRPTSPGLFGLGSVGTGLMLGGLVVVIVVVMVGGLLAGAVTFAVGAGLMLTVTTKDLHHRSTASRAATRGAWWQSRSQGLNLYRSGPLGRALWGTHQLPGMLAATRLSEHLDGYGRAFAMLYTPATSTFAVTFVTEPDGAALVDDEQVDQWVADWGGWLANLGDEPGLDAASVTIESAPDSGVRLRREIDLNIDPNSPEFAQQMLREVVATYPVGSSTVTAYVTLVFNAALHEGKADVDEVAHEIAARLPGLTASLGSTGAGAAHPMSAQQVCEMVRVAYDPAAAVDVDEVYARGEVPEMHWSDVGPAAYEEMWDEMRHDSGRSTTWSMTAAPRGLVQSNVLARLLAPHRDVARKRVTLLYRPIDAARAAGIVEADLRAAQFRATSSAKPTARDTIAVRAAAATAAEEASGAGLVLFGVLVTATSTDPGKRRAARAAIASLSATARLRVRPVYGSQAAAFAACLPLGLVLPKHVQVPQAMRERL